MVSRLVKAALGVAVVAGGALAAQGPAQAADGPHHWMYTDDSGSGGRVDFWPDGDIVQLCDKASDGARAEVDVYDNGGYLYHLEAAGNGVCGTRRASDGGKYDLAENHCFTFVIYLTDGGVVIPASRDVAQWVNDNNDSKSC